MTIDEAIGILSMLESRTQNYSTCFKKDALKLGIGALIRVKEIRKLPIPAGWKDLPRETKEEKLPA